MQQPNSMEFGALDQVLTGSSRAPTKTTLGWSSWDIMCFSYVFFMLVNLIFKWPPLDNNEKQDPVWGFRPPIKSLAPGCAMSWRHLPLHAKTPKQHWPIWPSDFRILMLCVVNSVNSCFSQFCTACGGYNTNFRLGNCKATLSRQVPSSYSKNRFSMLCQMHSKAAKGHARHVLWCKKTPDYICVGKWWGPGFDESVKKHPGNPGRFNIILQEGSERSSFENPTKGNPKSNVAYVTTEHFRRKHG